MTLKILAVAEFDPCAVLSGHREALRALGVDYRLAIQEVYTAHIDSLHPDWLAIDPGCDFDALAAFAANADIIQFHPGIGQPWSAALDVPARPHDAHEVEFGPLRWASVSRNMRGRRVAYFHGSRNTAMHAATYAEAYRTAGMAIWASTLDYVAWLGATYAPPAIAVPPEPAALRGDDDPLVVVHAPTDPSNCHTAEFTQAAARAGIVSRYAAHLPHAEVMALKQQSNAGFDHMRGAFSVNTLENAMLGLVPIVGLHHDFAELPAFAAFRPEPLVAPRNRDELITMLRWLDDQPAVTRKYQTAARKWAITHFSPEAVGRRLHDAYRSLLA